MYMNIQVLFFHNRYNDILFDHPGDGIHQYKLRSYMRLLRDIAYAASISEKCEVSLYAYEELLRVDNEDFSSARLFLVLLYLKMIGREIRMGSSTIKRTKEHLQKLLDSTLTFSDGPLFEGDSNTIVYRWLQLLRVYLDNDKEQLVKLIDGLCIIIIYI